MSIAMINTFQVCTCWSKKKSAVYVVNIPYLCIYPTMRGLSIYQLMNLC